MASGSTPNLAIPYPQASDPPFVNSDIQAIATYLDNNLAPFSQGATVPVSPVKGTWWWCTNTSSTSYGINYYDGTTWHNYGANSIYFGTSAPSVVYQGLVWFNTTNASPGLAIYIGTAWVTIIPSAATNGLAILSTSGGWAAGAPVDTTKVAKTGDTMTGPLILSGDPTVALGASTKEYVDAETTARAAADALLIPKANNNAVLTAPVETSYITVTVPGAPMNIYVSTNATSILCTTNASANFSFNVASTSGATLNALLSIGQEITIAIKVKQGTTAYYCTAISIDGTTQTVNWQGGVAPSSGFPSGYDIYSINIVKTANATYTVFASLAQF